MPDDPKTADPFAHHPELRDLIKDPLTSRFRELSLDHVRMLMDEHGLQGGWWYSNEEREALRAAFMPELTGGDLWVFGYGSLMTDPGLLFAEVRRATLPRHARKFILRDENGARGRPEAPGLMAALDTAGDEDVCEGLAFRIRAELVEQETEILWRREMIAPGYHATIVPARIGGLDVPVLAFLADHDADVIVTDISRAEQIQMIATGKGFFGSSQEYLENIDRQFAALGIVDPEVADLLRDVRTHAAPSH
ncbi:gamma-glutamylcyclotransferase [Flavimaricola marinus]|uniref:glutathione-specific gamma-glutamylcyclotransferase n=1 Tax=Flavimaricola marinus TaxID=1819565 RepID=A0A238L934_9RHOB|nr:gamma-glutamylcyclotransferase [Flavimaricola marinus]SMY06189.1 ChaC-like protein [Flavimaricola marinus]